MLSLSLCYYGVTTTILTTHKPSSNHVKKTHTHTVHTQGSCTSNKHLKETKAYCSTYYPHVIIKCNTSRIAVIKNKTKGKKTIHYMNTKSSQTEDTTFLTTLAKTLHQFSEGCKSVCRWICCFCLFFQQQNILYEGLSH